MTSPPSPEEFWAIRPTDLDAELRDAGEAADAVDSVVERRPGEEHAAWLARRQESLDELARTLQEQQRQSVLRHQDAERAAREAEVRRAAEAEAERERQRRVAEADAARETSRAHQARTLSELAGRVDRRQDPAAVRSVAERYRRAREERSAEAARRAAAPPSWWLRTLTALGRVFVRR